MLPCVGWKRRPVFIMSLLAAAHWTGFVPHPRDSSPNSLSLLLQAPQVTRYSRAAESAGVTSAREGPPQQQRGRRASEAQHGGRRHATVLSTRNAALPLAAPHAQTQLLLNVGG